MKRILPLFLVLSLSAHAQVTSDSLSTSGGGLDLSGWDFSDPEQYDAADLINAKADQFYVSVEHRPDSLEALRWRFVQRHLQPGELFVDFFYTELNGKPVYLTSFVEAGGGPSVAVVPVPAEATDDAAQQVVLRGVKNNGGSGRSFLLYKNLMAFLEPHLAGVHTIYYSPANDMALVNLRFLKDRDGRLLFEKYKMIRLHTGASFIGEKQRLRFPKKLSALLVGNVSYDCNGNSPDPFWNPLPGSKDEIRNIAHILRPNGTVDMLDSCKATEERFVHQINTKNYDVLHLATHGFFFEEPNERYGLTAGAYRLLAAGIVLSGANSGKASVDPNNGYGLFTAMDFRQLDMSHLKLVVLSACHSGAGEKEHSSAPLGLTLALLRQGVGAMMLSNRAIPDRETAEFMTTFYRHLARLSDADAAFTATLRELHTAKPGTDWSFMDLVH